MHKILVIEDDQTVNELLSGNLEGLGYKVDTAFDGEQGLNLALLNNYQLILLDVMIPKLNGFQVLKSLRDTKQTPVIFLTAKGGEQDRIFGFKTGADDYLIKPFSMAELELRIQAILRRTQKSNDFSEIDTLQQSINTVSSKCICLNKMSGEVMIHDNPVVFTPIEFDILYALIEACDEVLSKAYLYQNILLREFSRYDRTLDMHISKIRKKITVAGISVNTIKTVRGLGYCFES
jgi:two-component system response regulator PfeR